MESLIGYRSNFSGLHTWKNGHVSLVNQYSEKGDEDLPVSVIGEYNKVPLSWLSNEYPLIFQKITSRKLRDVPRQIRELHIGLGGKGPISLFSEETYKVDRGLPIGCSHLPDYAGTGNVSLAEILPDAGSLSRSEIDEKSGRISPA